MFSCIIRKAAVDTLVFLSCSGSHMGHMISHQLLSISPPVEDMASVELSKSGVSNVDVHSSVGSLKGLDNYFSHIGLSIGFTFVAEKENSVWVSKYR